jgi:chaperone required for assembly of F1-ATPase
MSDAKTPDYDGPVSGFTPPTKVLGREAKVVRKRFYKLASAAPLASGFTVHLDGRGVKTPGKAPLVVAVLPLAEALAAEWAAQGEEIKPSTMPLTTLACTAIDAVAPKRAEVADEIGRYAMSDLLCYRADAPAGLVVLQTTGWDPVLSWASGELGVSFKRATGIMHVEQSPKAAEAMIAALLPLDPLRLAAMHILTSLMGSALLALAVLRRHLSLDEAWRLAHLDDQWQIDRWGTDEEAELRQAGRLRTATAAARVLEMVGG